MDHTDWPQSGIYGACLLQHYCIINHYHSEQHYNHNKNNHYIRTRNNNSLDSHHYPIIVNRRLR
jgi:hypothetical protein